MYDYIKIEGVSLDANSIHFLKTEIHFYLKGLLGSLDYESESNIKFIITSNSNFEYEVISVRVPKLVVTITNSIASNKKNISKIISKYI